MKKIQGLVFGLACLSNLALAQLQLDIEGLPSGTSTVAKIEVKSSSKADIIGLHVSSKPFSIFDSHLYGIAGKFEGGFRGVEGIAFDIFGSGVSGYNQTGTGVTGSSTTGTGVRGFSGRVGVYGQSLGSPSSLGVSGYSDHGVAIYGISDDSTAVHGKSSADYQSAVVGISEGQVSKGVYGKGTYGVFGDSFYTGVFGRGSIGIYGQAVGGGSTAVYGRATDELGSLAARFDGNVELRSGYLSVDGLICASGQIYSMSTSCPSDLRLKTDVKPLRQALDLVNQLQPSLYQFIDHPTLELPTGQRYGLIAQELETILPDLVSDFSPDWVNDTYKAVNYVELIPILIAAVQELSIKNEELIEMINVLRRQ